MRERGQGTIVELTDATGTVTGYRVAVTMADGQRVWRRCRTKRAAEAKRRELVDDRELEIDPSRQTLAAYLRSWIAELTDARNRRIRPTTLRHYASIVEGHIIPGLDPRDRLPLSRLNERRIQAWLDASDGSARSLHHYRAVLRRALNVAVRRRHLARNPALGVELPEPDSDVGKPLTLDEAKRLLEGTQDDRLGVLWRLALVTGLRQAELLGLGWEDLDLEAGTLTVRAQIQRLGGSWVRTAPKAARGLTRIALDPGTVTALDRHRLAMATERKPSWRYHGLVFTTRHGTPFHGRTILGEFHEALDRAKLPRRRFHDLRATSATLMREAGVAEDARMARLGHSTTEMARHYGRASEEQDRAAVATLARRLS